MYSEMPKINSKVIMSGAEFFSDDDAINDLMDSSVPVDVDKAILEHQSLKEAFLANGIEVVKIDPPSGCQDGIYVANWALIRGHKAIMSRLPNKRKPEEVYAKKTLDELGFETLILPDNIRAFSGQGDALICGDILFTQSPYRTSSDAHAYLKDWLGFEKVIALSTKPARWFEYGPPKKNKLTGWPDSPTYDIDLALAILKPKTDTTKALIAFCPAVFKKSSRKILAELNEVDKIEVSKKEALGVFALNLVSTGETVILNSGAPEFKRQLEDYGLKTVELSLPELRKGGGSIRCCSLTL